MRLGQGRRQGEEEEQDYEKEGLQRKENVGATIDIFQYKKKKCHPIGQLDYSEIWALYIARTKRYIKRQKTFLGTLSIPGQASFVLPIIAEERKCQNDKRSDSQAEGYMPRKKTAIMSICHIQWYRPILSLPESQTHNECLYDI